MMNSFDKNLLPDEKIIFRTKKHPIIFLIPVIISLFVFFFLFNSNEFVVRLTWLPALGAGIVWAGSGLVYWTSEFAITNKRIMMREGFFIRHINETRLSAIANVSITQSLIGQLFNYGTISINAFGGETDTFVQISAAYQFQQKLQEQLVK